ncbi:MAG: TIGR02391 family protein [Propionibacteriaceae bacterium]|nr:TIGR02391 family protein [Propionibacteriaceae bacterium]
MTIDAYSLWPTSEAIIRELAPERLPGGDHTNREWPEAALMAVIYTLSLIDQQPTIAEQTKLVVSKLDPTGLHPSVWNSAAPLWEASRQDAVNAAARAVNSQLQTKLGITELSEVDLTNQAFSGDPPAAQRPRLRFAGHQPSSDSFKSRMNGARGLGQACFQGVRNIGNHEHDVRWSEQEALEYLALFSVLARWIDECTIEQETHGAS